MLRAILASQQPDRCRRAQAFISTQGLAADTVAELVAEEVTRELLSSSEGAGTLPSMPQPSHSDHFYECPPLGLWMMCSYILHAALSGYQVALVKKNTFHLFLLFV